MNLTNKNRFQSWAGALRSLPRFVWVFMLGVFILGFILRGGGKKDAMREMTSPEHVHEEGETEWWTCSMHPQIKLPEPGQCPICFMDLIPMEAGDMGDAPAELKMSHAAVKLAEIATARVRRGMPERTIRLSGKVTTDETRVGKITAWVPGRLEKLFVDYTGVEVQKGDPLVELYSPSLYTAQEEFLQAARRAASSESAVGRESARITMEAAREKLRQLGLTDDQIEAVDSLDTASDRVTINSPMAGVVIHKNALEGLYVQRGTQVYTIADLSKIWVVLDAYESDLAWLEVGQSVSFTAEALHGKRFEGEVVFVDPVLNERTRTVTVRLNADNRERLLKPGMFVRADIHARVPGGRKLLVPATSVLKTGKRAVVYVQKPGTEDPVFEGRVIEVGARVDGEYIVESGLKEGEVVVVKGNFKIDSAFQIAAKTSMMNPEGGVTMTDHEHHEENETETLRRVPQRSGTRSGQAETKVKEETIVESSAFQERLTQVYAAYFEMQAALANDAFETMVAAAKRLDDAVKAVGDETLEGHAVHRWTDMKKRIHDAAQHAHHWPGIEDARSAFEKISLAVLDLERRFGHAGSQTHYEAFCPMAFDNKGASWLQNHDTVDNPYFGARMLRCGEIRETFVGKE